MPGFTDSLYLEDVARVAERDLPWEKLKDRTVMISGASGMIGSCLIDVLRYRNRVHGMNCRIIALGRSEQNMFARFPDASDDPAFRFVQYDMSRPLAVAERADYVLHLASNTHPVAYATNPISTITTNVIGLNYLLDYAANHGTQRFAFASSNEIYGENRGDVEFFDEQYCGYINCNALRAGYPESKRCGEALCQAYRKEKGLDVVIPRLTRTYGPTMLMSDTKAISQFIRKAIAGENIILKSAGTQYYSYTYVSDAVAGLLTVLMLGESGEAYNIADATSDIMLKDLAALIASSAGCRVVFELPDAVEKEGFSVVTKARLDGNKLKMLGWQPDYDIQRGISRLMMILCH